MHISPPLLASISKRLIPSVYGISKKGVHVQCDLQIERTSAGTVQVGEDAAFVSLGNSSRYHVCGVADGVGGWNKQGIDPSFFSKVLMENCCRVSVRGTVNLSKPVEILSRAFTEMTCHSKCYGSSTACLLSLDRSTGVLHTANLGDSGYLVVRDGSVVAESQTLTHYFNCPYQLSILPPQYKSKIDRDKPSSAITSSFKLEAGDFIVTATDGLFDNMYTKDIADFLRNFRFTAQADLDKMVQEMVAKTFKLSIDQSYLSPFADSGSRALSWEFQGGKPDDITILLAAVTDCEEQQQPDDNQPSR